MDLSGSKNLKELPDLSNATNLKELDLNSCESLVEIPSSFSHLHKLNCLDIINCINLQIIPAHMNLASLVRVYMIGCKKLRNIPVMSTNIRLLYISYCIPSIRLCSRLKLVSLCCSGKLKELTHLPKSVTHLDLSDSDIKKIPDCIKALHQLIILNIGQCRRLTSLPELPGSLISLMAENCGSLETVFFPLSTPNAEISFANCIKLGQQARRWIIRRSFCYSKTLIPGRKVPAEFDNRARGSSLTIVLGGNMSYSDFVFCVVISPNRLFPESSYSYSHLSWLRIIAQDDGYPVEDSVQVYSFNISSRFNEFRTEHLLIFHEEVQQPEVNREMMFEFSSESRYFEIIECGAKILTQEESIEWSYESGSDQVFENDIDYSDPTNLEGDKQTDCWSWLFLCLGLSDFGKKRRKLCFEEEDDRKKAEAD